MSKNNYNGIILGPLLKEDAEFLQAIIKMTTPKVLVEFGYFWGDSARAMLEVMREDAELHSFDNTKDPVVVDSRFHFYKKSQEEIEGIKDIDFVFLDASHELDLNIKTFEKLVPYLSDKAIIAVHDTGTWVGGNVFNVEAGYLKDNGEYVHRPDELEFVNWVKERYPQFQQIHFHSSREVRHGITLLQNYAKL